MIFSVHYNCNAQQHHIIYKLHQLTDTVIYIANLTGRPYSRILPLLRFVLEIIAQVLLLE